MKLYAIKYIANLRQNSVSLAFNRVNHVLAEMWLIRSDHRNAHAATASIICRRRLLIPPKILHESQLIIIDNPIKLKFPHPSI